MSGAVQQQTALSSGFQGLERTFAAVDSAASISALQELVQTVVVSMLRRGEDSSLRDRTLATISAYFLHMRGVEGLTPRDRLAHLRSFAKQTVQIVFDERPVSVEAQARLAPLLPPPAPAAETPRRRATDQDQPDTGKTAATPPAAAPVIDLTDFKLGVTDVEKPTSIHIPATPEAEKFATFRELFAAALRYRLCSLTRFFQRRNDEAGRSLVRPFLLSEEFETRFMQVVDTIIVPKMFTMSRNLIALETSRKWDEVSSAVFWAVIGENDKTRIAVIGAWEEAWTSCRQHEVRRKGENGETRKVLVATPELKKIREMLTPSDSRAYDMPPVRNREIDFFIAMLTDFDLTRLEYCFTKLRQMYEQELDRRWYQDRARSGALRDSLLEAIDAFPDRTGDFLALVCYYCFPNTDLVFLEKFTHNKGSDHATRVQRLPYLMRFLANEEVPGVRAQEVRERAEREATAKEEAERQREQERAAAARLGTEIGQGLTLRQPPPPKDK